MANKQGPFGLKPVRHIDGSPWNGALTRCYVSASYGTALYCGDPVIFDTTLGDKDTTARHPTIIKSAGTSGTLTRGVIVGFEPLPTDLSKRYNPVSTERWALVCMDASVVYHIRDNGTGAPTKVFPGQNAEMSDAGGSTVTGLSGYQLDASTPTTTQAFPLHIIGLAPIEDNELDDYAIWEVMLNTPENATGRVLGITAA